MIKAVKKMKRPAFLTAGPIFTPQETRNCSSSKVKIIYRFYLTGRILFRWPLFLNGEFNDIYSG